MTFDELREANIKRCNTVFHLLDEWSSTDWACAVAGETGDMCSAVKKLKRGDGSIDAVSKELADIVIYADLLAARLGINLEDAIAAKFNEVSRRVDSDSVLPTRCSRWYECSEVKTSFCYVGSAECYLLRRKHIR